MPFEPDIILSDRGVFMLLLILLLIGAFLLYLLLLLPRFSKRREMMLYNHQSFAHRGLHSKEHLIPENSIKAFKEAIKRHLGIELDVHLTKDGKVVVFHDDDLFRMCHVHGTIEEKTYADLKQLYLDNTSEQIPLLTEVLTLVDGRVPLLIELKLPGRDTALCRKTQEILDAYHGSYLIQSFNTLVLHWYRSHAPQVLRGQLSSNLMKDKEKNVMFLRFLSTFLLLNLIGQPDFISYKYKDRKNLSLILLQNLYHTPIAVWTLRNERDYIAAKKCYNIVIFEKISENY